MVLGLVMKERILISPPQKVHNKGSISNTFWIILAQLSFLVLES